MVKKDTEAKKAIRAALKFGEELTAALSSDDRRKIVPKLEEKLNEAVDELSPQELGTLGMIYILMLSKIAFCQPTTEEGQVKTAVVSCRALVSAMDQSGKLFGMDHFAIATHMAIEPIFKPSKEQLKDALIFKHFEDMDPVGEC